MTSSDRGNSGGAVCPDRPEAAERVALPEPASFRDPAGFVYTRGGVLYRQVSPAGAAAYERLMASGLYDALIEAGLLIPHDEARLTERMTDDARYVLRPERVPFVSYPYEWPFAALRAAALTTLAVQRTALAHGMSLRDASAYNVQFVRGVRPVHIDTLSFEPYREGAPWPAYRQFCQHFLAPLALMAHADVRLSSLLRAGCIDGVPLDLAARLLPFRARLDPALLPHIFLHRAAQRRHEDDGASVQRRAASPPPAVGMPKTALLGLLDSLEAGIRRLAWRPRGTEWGDYYESGMNYAGGAFAAKQAQVGAMLDAIRPARAFDLGANAGVFSRLAAERGAAHTVALDVDPAAVEKAFLNCQADGTRDVLPLVQDLTDPSPALGWAHEERKSLLQRCRDAARDAAPEGPTVTLALALVHHLAIGNNVPLPRVAALFADVAEQAIVEWVPKDDPQVRRLLATREDVFPDYHEAGFERAFAGVFAIAERAPVAGTGRVLYRLRRLGSPRRRSDRSEEEA